MASTLNFFEALKNRRSVYAISSESTIPDSQIEEIVKTAVLHTPSSFNVQAGRAVALFGKEHEKLWDICYKRTEELLGPEKFGGLEGKIKGLRAGHGTVMFFEDEDALTELARKNPLLTALIPEWGDHSQGILHFVVWSALAAEGLGANLQHYNWHPAIEKEVLDTWNLPKSWKLKAQLVYGKPTGSPREKTFEPVEKRFQSFA